MFRLRHSDSICFRFCTEGSVPEKANSSSSGVLPFGCGQIGLRGDGQTLRIDAIQRGEERTRNGLHRWKSDKK